MSTHTSPTTDDRHPTETPTYRPTLDYRGERWTASTPDDDQEHRHADAPSARCRSLFDATNRTRLPNLVDAANQSMLSTTSTDP